MAQRHIVQSKIQYWKEKGYEIVPGAPKLGPPGTDQLILVEKKEKVEKPLQKKEKEEVKDNARGNKQSARNVQSEPEQSKSGRGNAGRENAGRGNARGRK